MGGYLCKDCKSNNYGWCEKLKFNGLKKILECKYKEVKVYSPEDKEVDCHPSIFTSEEETPETNPHEGREGYEAYKSMGKREIFYTIQRELNSMSSSSTILDVKKVMVNLEQLLLITEGIHGIQTECEIDEDVINASKLMSSSWAKEVSGGK